MNFKKVKQKEEIKRLGSGKNLLLINERQKKSTFFLTNCTRVYTHTNTYTHTYTQYIVYGIESFCIESLINSGTLPSSQQIIYIFIDIECKSVLGHVITCVQEHRMREAISASRLEEGDARSSSLDQVFLLPSPPARSQRRKTR